MRVGTPATEAPVPAEVNVPLEGKAFRKEYGFNKIGVRDERPWQIKLHEASKGWGRLGVFIQGIILGQAFRNLDRRNRQ